MRFLLAVLALLVAVPCHATPAITAASGTIGNGETVTITGTSFGSGPTIANIKSLMANIEAGTGNFSASGWDAVVGGGTVVPVYSTTQKHSGSKALKSTYADGQYDCGIQHDSGGLQSAWYLTWWAYFDGSPTAGQWKMIFSQQSSLSDRPYAGMNRWWGGNIGTPSNLIDGPADSCGSYGCNYWPEMSPPKTALFPGLPENCRINTGEWVRYETMMIDSTVDTANGTYIIRFHRPTSQTIGYIRNDAGNTMTLDSDSPNAGRRYFTWLNYWGNDAPEIEPNIYLDDVVASYGTGALARVELCDYITWAGSTFCEYQIPSSWADTSIAVTLNQGSFAADATAYLYVVDATGAVNSTGYQVVFGASGGAQRIITIGSGGTATLGSGGTVTLE